MTRSRLTAEQRHEQVVQAAVTAFTEGGYAGTTTDQVARLAGVSQPYVIRLFGGKQKLFIAALHHACGQVEEQFRAAAREEPTLASLGAAYERLLAQREVIAVLLHGFAAGADPAIGPVVRELFGRIYESVRELTGASAEEARDFLAFGMLLTVLGSMQVMGPYAVPPAPWAADLLCAFDKKGRGEAALVEATGKTPAGSAGTTSKTPAGSAGTTGKKPAGSAGTTSKTPARTANARTRGKATPGKARPSKASPGKAAPDDAAPAEA